MGNLKFSRLVNAPPDVVWNVISDVEDYAAVAPNLSRAVILSGQEEGMVRRCWDTRGGTWTEQCTLWEEGRRYSMQVDTSDYPYPFTKMQGTWGVEEQEGGTLITMVFGFTPKFGPLGEIAVHVGMKRSFEKICSQLLDNWELRIQERLAAAQN